MFEPLRAALVAQYAAFKAPQPRAVTGCSCCTTPTELTGLVATPREALAPGALERYAAKAMTTIGSIDDFRYFWPRLAELAAEGRLLSSAETVFGKPLYGHHRAWPAPERAALLALAAALGEWIATEELDPDQVDSWVCAIGLVSETLCDVRQLLAPLLADTPTARAALRALVDSNRDDLQRKGRLANAYWDNAPEGAALVAGWLRTEPRALETARALVAEEAEQFGIIPPAS
jgi:hypothetical protein